MAEEDEPDVDASAEEGEDGGEEEGGKSGGKKKLLIIVAVLLLLVIGGAAAAYFTGLADPLVEAVMGPSENATEEGAPVEMAAGVFYDLPEMLVNLNTTGRTQQFIKLRVSIEIENEAQIPQVERIMPRIVDSFQIYLRELRVDDLKGSAGLYRVREELLKRVKAAAAPIEVRDVLFREMLIQ